jgi:hypothetical protein
MHAIRTLITAALVTVAVTVPAAPGQATSLRAPGGGWIAGTVFGHNPSDPVNVVLYDPEGHADTVLGQAIQAKGWSYNPTCVNWGVYLAADAGGWLGGWGAPITSYSTDAGGDGGCGTGERDHLRLWTTSDDKWAYVAASFEKRCSPGPHCIVSEGFDRARWDLDFALGNGLTQNVKRTYKQSDLTPYDPGTLQGIAYDGYVSYFDLSASPGS